MSVIRPVCAVFLLASCFLSGIDARASDYAVSYAVDTDDINDWGVTACEYKSFCRIDSRRAKLSISLDFATDDNHESVTIRASGDEDEWDCCYFTSGANVAKRDVRELPIRLLFYAKRRFAANEFFLNQPLGILYLQFLDTK